jgi:hypothetical protein
MTKKKSKKKSKKRTKPEPAVGDLIAIPLEDGSFGLGHVVERPGEIMVVLALLTARAAKAAALADVEAGQPIACLEVTGEDIRDGDWPIVGSRPCEYGPEVATRYGESYSDNACELVLSRWHELIEYVARDRLLPGVYFPGVDPPPPPPTKGPGEIVVILDHLDKRIRNTAKMLALHPFRDRILGELPERLPTVACNLIDGQNDGFGGGMLQAHFAVDAVELTLPVIEQMIADWEHADIASVEVRAIVPK